MKLYILATSEPQLLSIAAGIQAECNCLLVGDSIARYDHKGRRLCGPYSLVPKLLARLEPEPAA